MRTRSLAQLDQAALRAAGQRAESGAAGCVGAATTAPYAVFATTDCARRMLRRVLCLKRWVAISCQADEVHPVAEGAVGQALRLRISGGDSPREFLAAYDEDRRFALSPIAPCPHCAAQVPTVCVTSLADYGDWLHSTRELAEFPLYRTSPAHRDDCPIPHQLPGTRPCS
ncbi:hypothetical protein OG413_44760 [Streptomyces sp. NBC_01433]|uniref:hypothetical protein n=1 Tax=Streptomyces sp. NBC_01433 TaxID=2903864 RepID=UPI00225A88F0|nr:hypothetical protein [Streptomyces sp. NBC_01433]MCX4682297.1 hypothetical protein [Streptomyces sp. NBC_01433]